MHAVRYIPQTSQADNTLATWTGLGVQEEIERTRVMTDSHRLHQNKSAQDDGVHAGENKLNTICLYRL